MLKELLKKIAAGGLRNDRDAESSVAISENTAAEACANAGKLGLAEHHLQTAIHHDSRSSALHYNLGLLRHNVGDVSGAEEAYQHALELESDRQEVHSSLLSICDFSRTLRGGAGFSLHREWAETYADPLTVKAEPHTNDPDSQRRLRVGYVSSDFRNHVIGRFIEPVLRAHNRQSVEIFCYSTSALMDETTRRLMALAPHWRNISALDDDQASERIRGDAIDLLVDLAGHSSGNRLLMFARKPAPVQLTWMGYLNTTGMTAMDYKMTDAVADPFGVEPFYREKLLRLPHSQWCYNPGFEPPNDGARQSRLNSSRLLLGCMARFMKISNECVDLWIELLHSVENSDLRLVDVPDHPRAAELLARFAEAGLASRVSILPTLLGDEYWKRIMELDLALDPFPYTGATTSLDCLWMGVPVITLAGSYGAERSAASILSGIGCQHLIASSSDEYVQIARLLNADRSRLGQLRSMLHERVRTSPLCDSRSFTADLEKALRSVWSHWCQAQKEKSQ